MAWKERIKSLMEERGLNQKELSKLSGITEPSISRYLKGERTPRIDIIVNFAKALDVSVEYLLNGTNVEGIQDIKTAIARHGSKLTKEEQNELIELIRGK